MTRLSITFPPELMAELRAEAKRTETPLATIIRMAVRAYLKEQKS